MRIQGGTTFIFAVGLLAFLGTRSALAAGDAERGARAFRQCIACHSIEPGLHMTGPSLASVLGRKAGSIEGFTRYSDALRAAQLTWTEATLDQWLRDPAALVPGNTMTFPGIPDAQARQDIVAYLKAVPQGTAAAQPRPQLPNLKQASAESRVTRMRHCKDTYEVVTADGKAHRIWEFNLRLKSDTSPSGPRPNEPVIVGAGMRGDRASVVFSNPAEISSFIRDGC
ncbi:MAG: cytochrome c family protein [Burkholderiales bacterium]|nr:cytochrome c family protein [Burkholderiales bacterium]